MADIEVQHLEGDEYAVEVSEHGSSSRHRVTVPDRDRARLGGDASAEELLEASFRFLLEREPKESILSSFEITVIGRYFPEYPDEIRRRLEAG